MDKKTFLLNLQKSLSVLQEEELQDIISEYEQHIDMKVERGLTEEEAIADFGSMTELTAEILEAYHVRADYASSASGRKEKGSGFWRKDSGQISDDLTKENRGAAVLGFLRKTIGHLKSAAGIGFSAAGAVIKKGFLWGRNQISRPFRWFLGTRKVGREKEYLGIEQEEPSPGRRRRKSRRRSFMEDKRYRDGAENSERTIVNSGEGILYAVGRGIGTVFHSCINAVLWCIRLGWNLCCVGASMVTGAFGLFCLYGLGVLIVLLFQGYPLFGITLGCLGLVLCMFSLTAFGLTLRWIPARQNKTARQNEITRHSEAAGQNEITRQNEAAGQNEITRHSEAARGEKRSRGRGESAGRRQMKMETDRRGNGVETGNRVETGNEIETGNRVETGNRIGTNNGVGTDNDKEWQTEEDDRIRVKEDIDRSESEMDMEVEQHA